MRWQGAVLRQPQEQEEEQQQEGPGYESPAWV